MKVNKLMHGYSLRLTDSEFTTLEKAMNATPVTLLWSLLTNKERRSYSRRCGIDKSKYYLRVDNDRRGDM